MQSHFVRYSKLLNHCAHFFDYLFIFRSFGNIHILNKVNGMVVKHSCVNFVFFVTPLRITVAVGLYGVAFEKSAKYGLFPGKVRIF